VRSSRCPHLEWASSPGKSGSRSRESRVQQVAREGTGELGSVKICDPDDIKKFHTIKGKAERVLKRAGLPVLGAVGIPVDKFDAVHDELVQLQAEFKALSDSFIIDYDRRVSAWKESHILANPGWARLFAHIPTATHVAGRIAFDFHAFKIAAPADDMKPELNARYDTQIKGLKGELMKEDAGKERESTAGRGQHRWC
jgi:hypothetical protein